MNETYTEEPDELELSVLEAKKLRQNCNALISDNNTLKAENARLKALLNKRGKWSEADFIDTLEDFFSLCEHGIGHGFSDDDLLFAREEYKRFLDIEKQVSTLKRNCQNLIRDNNALKGKD